MKLLVWLLSLGTWLMVRITSVIAEIVHFISIPKSQNGCEIHNNQLVRNIIVSQETIKNGETLCVLYLRDIIAHQPADQNTRVLEVIEYIIKTKIPFKPRIIADILTILERSQDNVPYKVIIHQVTLIVTNATDVTVDNIFQIWKILQTIYHPTIPYIFDKTLQFMPPYVNNHTAAIIHKTANQLNININHHTETSKQLAHATMAQELCNTLHNRYCSSNKASKPFLKAMTHLQYIIHKMCIANPSNNDRCVNKTHNFVIDTANILFTIDRKITIASFQRLIGVQKYIYNKHGPETNILFVIHQRWLDAKYLKKVFSQKATRDLNVSEILSLQTQLNNPATTTIFKTPCGIDDDIFSLIGCLLLSKKMPASFIISNDKFKRHKQLMRPRPKLLMHFENWLGHTIVTHKWKHTTCKLNMPRTDYYTQNFLCKLGPTWYV